jgi:hypothetical protein
VLQEEQDGVSVRLLSDNIVALGPRDPELGFGFPLLRIIE